MHTRRKPNVIYLMDIWYGQVFERKNRLDPTYHRPREPESINLLFQSELKDILQSFLKKEGIEGNNYIVFSWRSETIPMNRVLECTNELVKDANRWKTEYFKNEKMKSILVSDISLDPTENPTWDDEQSRLSRDILTILNENFLKLEKMEGRLQLVHRNKSYSDLMFATVWDIMLAVDSMHLIGCTNPHSNLCQKCSRYNSNFVLEMYKDRAREKGRKCASSWDAIGDFHCNHQMKHHHL